MWLEHFGQHSAVIITIKYASSNIDHQFITLLMIKSLLFYESIVERFEELLSLSMSIVFAADQ